MSDKITNRDHARIRPSTTRKWSPVQSILYTSIIVGLFFLGLELILTFAGVRPLLELEDPMVGFAGDIPLYREVTLADGRLYMQTAENKRRLFNDQVFPKSKPDNSFRIFCLGGSTTFGRPYYDEVSFCGWLRAYLQAADGNRTWEVINAGGISYASYRVARLMNELNRYQPDLYLVYSGQNEFLEERSYGKLLDMPPSLLRLNSLLSGTRVYTVMKQAVDLFQQGSVQPGRERYQLSEEVDDILSHTVGPSSYQRDDELHHQIITHYRYNLERMIEIASSAGAGILFIKPASNLKDMSPFKSENRGDLSPAELNRWQLLYRRGMAMQQAGQLKEALAVYREAWQIDSRHAELNYRMGQVLYGLGEYDPAEQAFRLAADEDVAPLRILSTMVGELEQVAADYDVDLIDFPALLQQAYTSNNIPAIPGKEYFVDHVHTNIDGYRLLGMALMNYLAAKGIARPGANWNEDTIAAVNARVMSTQDGLNYGQSLKNLGSVLGWAGKFEEAYRIYHEALQYIEGDAEIYLKLANACRALGKTGEALDYYLRASSLEPDTPQLHFSIAQMFEKQDDYPAAVNHYLEELELDADNHFAHTKLAILLSRLGDKDKARRHFDSAVKTSPGTRESHLDLAYYLFLEKRFAEAEVHFREVLRGSPGEFPVHNFLGVVLQAQGKLDEAESEFREALRLNPDYREAMLNLRQVLAEKEATKAPE